jgi:hypothetical protein
MEQSETLNKVIKLGELLVKELQQKGVIDTLTRWMAFYIAEKITAAKIEKGEKKAAAEKTCMETILTVWKHRWKLQPEIRPLRNFEHILETLYMLRPECTSSYHFEDDYEPKLGEGNTLLKEVKEIDQATKVCLNFLLSKAANDASTKDTAKWLNSAMYRDPEADLTIIKMLFSGENYSLAPEADSQEWNYDNDYAITKLKTDLNSIELLEKHTKSIKAQLKADIRTAIKERKKVGSK